MEENPFAGQGGSYYINPKGSNTLKRNRDDPAPFLSLSPLEKARRIVTDVTDPADRAARIAALNLTAEDQAALNSMTPSVQVTGNPPAASAAGDEPSAGAKAVKSASKGGK